MVGKKEEEESRVALERGLSRAWRKGRAQAESRQFLYHKLQHPQKNLHVSLSSSRPCCGQEPQKHAINLFAHLPTTAMVLTGHGAFTIFRITSRGQNL